MAKSTPWTLIVAGIGGVILLWAATRPRPVVDQFTPPEDQFVPPEEIALCDPPTPWGGQTWGGQMVIDPWGSPPPPPPACTGECPPGTVLEREVQGGAEPGFVYAVTPAYQIRNVCRDLETGEIVKTSSWIYIPEMNI